MDEFVFQAMGPFSTTIPTTQGDDKGFWAYNVTLVDIFATIQDVNLSLSHSQIERSTVDHKVASLEAKLHQWCDALPTKMIMNDSNLAQYRKQGRGGAFIALHFGYHHYCSLLYFQYLEAESPQSAPALAYIGRCRFHALAFSQLLYTARQCGDCHVVYLTVAHMTVVSSAVLLHMLLFGDEQEVDTSRLQLTRNFEALIELSRYWPHMDTVRQRLLYFQDACLRSSSRKTYTVDPWMLRFLLEYGLPLGAKQPIGDTRPQTPTPDVDDSTIPQKRRAMVDEALASLRT